MNIVEALCDYCHKLTEDIEAVKKNFPDIDDSMFMRLISLDPTFKHNDSVGTYGKWILNMYNKGRISESDFDKVTQYLDEFEQKKRWFENRDIQQFKSLDDMRDALNSVAVGELSDTHNEKKFKKDLKRAELNAEKVFDDDDWEVWIPKDYMASCKLASNTEWCTGPSSKGDTTYYDLYSNQGPLFININKHDRDEKYQFHFQSQQFMDREDSEIDLYEFLKRNKSLLEFYFPIICKPMFDKEGIELDEPDDTIVTIHCGLENCFELYDKVFGRASGRLSGDELYDIFDKPYDSVYIPEIYDHDVVDAIESARYTALKCTHLIDLLKKKGLKYDDLVDIMENPDDDRFDDINVSDIQFALSSATIDAVTEGTIKEAQSDVLSYIEQAFRYIDADNIKFDVNNDKFSCDMSVGLIKKYIFKSLGDENSDEEDTIGGILTLSALYEAYAFREPEYGFQGFDENTFIDSLYDNL